MSNEELKELFSDVLKFEKTALDIYVKILKEVKDEAIKKAIEDIAEDESVHANNAREILNILEEK